MGGNAKRSGTRCLDVLCLMLIGFLISAPASSAVSLRMQTDLGSLDLELFDTEAPLTVQNFMNYVNRGAMMVMTVLLSTVACPVSWCRVAGMFSIRMMATFLVLARLTYRPIHRLSTSRIPSTGPTCAVPSPWPRPRTRIVQPVSGFSTWLTTRHLMTLVIQVVLRYSGGCWEMGWA